MDILELARKSGMQVVLDGRIGCEEYQSVCGSIQALQRFAEAICMSLAATPQTTPTELEVRLVHGNSA